MISDRQIFKVLYTEIVISDALTLCAYASGFLAGYTMSLRAWAFVLALTILSALAEVRVRGRKNLQNAMVRIYDRHPFNRRSIEDGNPAGFYRRWWQLIRNK